MSGIKELFETIVSTIATVGGKAAESGGKSAAMATARKLGWVSKDKKQSRIHGHSLSGHRLGSGFGKAGELHNYDPKNHYQDKRYEMARLSGSGLAAAPMSAPRKGPLRRSNQISSFEYRSQTQKQTTKTTNNNSLRGRISLKGTRF